jgi:NAD(P)-dependent dehydrogenase (short-subunit alcohol dehydrogenase family)
MMKTDELSGILSFKGKTAFVTGGGSGINFGIARSFAALGANVSICSRSQERLDAAAVELRTYGGQVLPVAADVRNATDLHGAFEKSKASLGPADIVVAGAAGNFLCAAEGLSPNGFKTVIEIDLMGSFNTARAAFDQLKDTRGSILFISAGQSFLPYMHQVHVGAAKAGIDNMMRNLALEWGRFGIRSNSIAPGFIGDTEGTKRMAQSGAMAAIVKNTPLSRLGTVDDIGQMAVFLSSPLASFVTGALIVVDGGHYLSGSGILNAFQTATRA